MWQSDISPLSSKENPKITFQDMHEERFDGKQTSYHMKYFFSPALCVLRDNHVIFYEINYNPLSSLLASADCCA